MKTSELKSAKAQAKKLSTELQTLRNKLSNSGILELVTRADEAQVTITRLVSKLTQIVDSRESAEQAFINVSNCPDRSTKKAFSKK